MGPHTFVHPRQALFDPDELVQASLPVCDHYAGVEARMKKSLQLQAEMGPVFDITLDNEDGAPVGGEIEQAHLIQELLASPMNQFGRVGVRLLAVDHPKFADVLAIVLKSWRRPAYLMCPKPRGLADLQRAIDIIDKLDGAADATAAKATTGGAAAAPIPIHALVETHGALAQVVALAAHPRVQSLSFGLMDFVSAHRGALPRWAMSAEGQFDHPLVVRAKLEIAAACHAHGKVPSHCVVTEFKDLRALTEAADKASRLLGYTRMWSIHPAQIKPIVDSFAPTVAEVDEAIHILQAAQAAQWAPIRHHDTLHDRASYRFFWQVLQRAEATSFQGAAQLPAELRMAWFGKH